MSEFEQNGGGAASAALAPPPLISLDQPNPPNVVISQSSGLPLPQSLPPTGCVSSDPSGFMLSTRQIITASRLCPDLEVTSCANDEDVDLDKMYMEAMMEDLKYSVGR